MRWGRKERCGGCRILLVVAGVHAVTVGRRWSAGKNEKRKTAGSGGRNGDCFCLHFAGEQVVSRCDAGGFDRFRRRGSDGKRCVAPAFCGFPAVKVRREEGEQERLRREVEEDGEGRQLSSFRPEKGRRGWREREVRPREKGIGSGAASSDFGRGKNWEVRRLFGVIRVVTTWWCSGE
ncbi:hypothetical protein HAX54_001563, partial [Datura stramonium]|nr:hypothetical protein [Datura stramonium]